MAARRYLQVRGKHPQMPLRPALAEVWGGVPEWRWLGRCA